MTGTMRAAAFRAAGQIEIVQVPIPEPGPGEVRVRITACGLCGTDLHFFHMGPMAPGISPGHEMAGEVDALGDGVSEIRVGDRVAVEPLATCGVCDVCREGRDSICRECQLFGVNRSGGFAEFVSVPAHRAFPIAADLPPQLAALTEPMAVVVHGLRRASLDTGRRVLVLGAGAIGLLGTVAARALGAGEVWITARHPHQAELGASLGATRVIAESDLEPHGLGREAPIDLVLETVGGNAETLDTAAAAVRPGGSVSVVGVFTGRVGIEPFTPLMKEVTFCWSNCYARGGEEADFATAVRLVSEHRDALSALTTDSIPLDEIQRAYARAADKKAGVVKVSVLP